MLKQTTIFFLALAIYLSTYNVSPRADNVSLVGFLLGSSERVHGIFVDQLRQGLSEAGYVDGRNIELVYRFAHGKSNRAREHITEFIRRRVDVIVTVGVAQTRAAAEATQKIPIVVAYASDLDQMGFIASLARPGSNVTGITVLTSELAAKRLQLLTEAVSEISRVALLFSPTEGAITAVANTRSAAKYLGVTVQEVMVREPSDFAGAFKVIDQQQADAIIMVAGPVTSLHRRQLIKLAAARKLPSICWRLAVVQAGCLISYGADRSFMVSRAAGYVAKILQGAEPAILPVERPARIEIAVNLKTAQTLGITIPPSILLQATHVIE